MWALIVEGAVAELTSEDPTDRFHESLEWVECTSSTKVDYLFDGEKFSKPKQLQLTQDQVFELRRSAYRDESDPLKIEAEYDAIIAGAQPDYAGWLAKVEEIKALYPLPEQQS